MVNHLSNTKNADSLYKNKHLKLLTEHKYEKMLNFSNKRAEAVALSLDSFSPKKNLNKRGKLQLFSPKQIVCKPINLPKLGSDRMRILEKIEALETLVSSPNRMNLLPLQLIEKVQRAPQL